MKIGVKHILVQYQYEAEDILKLLSGGSDFEELAKKYSKCSSSKIGGDLGVVESSRLDQDFEDAASALKIGQTSVSPIRTRFGFHIIYRYL